MPAQDTLAEAILRTGTKLPVASLLSITGPVHAPYLVVTALDRGDYQAGSSGSVGSFLGNGVKLSLAAGTGDIRAAGIVFTWQSGQYTNPTYGSLSGLDFVSSTAPGEVTNLSVFTAATLFIATQDAGSPLALLRADEAGYAGSTTILNCAAQATPVPQATPDSVAARAISFVGLAWNNQGCWNLASTIAAQSGAGLPLSATALGVPGHGNGEWVVTYNGPLHSDPGWQSLVTQGDAITFGTPGGGGHITLCVAGAGATAMLVDNISFQNAQGQVANAAHDGATDDVLIAAPHPAIQEWAGVQPDSVVIYALDTPAIKDRFAVAALPPNSTASLSSLVLVTDPAGKAAIRFQAYETGNAMGLLLNGQLVAATTAAGSVSAASLTALSIATGTLTGAGLLEIRAFNGSYWGDWQTLPLQAGEPGSGSSQIRMADGLSVPATPSQMPGFATAPTAIFFAPLVPSWALPLNLQH
jgi:hypothetical protein